MSMDGSVIADDEVIRFRGWYRPELVRNVLRALNGFLIAKPNVIMLDFTECEGAFPNSMIPLITFVTKLRNLDYNIATFLPKREEIKHRFKETNWAHFLSPHMHRISDDHTEPHLAVKQYNSGEDQYSILNKMIDLVLKEVNTTRAALAATEWAMNEVMDNVINHSQSPIGGFVQLAIFPTAMKLAFCVADAGRGILESLREGYPSLNSDRNAIGEAVRAGITRNQEVGQGNGLSGSLALAIQTNGWFRIRSGLAEMVWTSLEPEYYEEPSGCRFHGTVVDVQLNYGLEYDVGAIISGSTSSPGYTQPNYKPVDFIELSHLSEDGKAMRLKMHKETFGFGSRFTGAQMQTKAMNLLQAEPTKELIIDWDGVPMISSSYADEFIGKLFLRLGPVEFNSRIKLQNMIPIVQTLINKAIMQRMQQFFQRK